MGRPKGKFCSTCKAPLVDGVNRVKDARRCQPCNVVYMKAYRKQRLLTEPDFESKAYQKNRERKKKYQREYTKRPGMRERLLDSYMKRTYGITLSDYNKLFASQNGVCAICSEPPKKKKLLVDHCHHSRQVRGLLCDRCNAGIGMFKSNKEFLIQAMLYISKWHGYEKKAA
jgi:hypothetical protein